MISENLKFENKKQRIKEREGMLNPSRSLIYRGFLMGYKSMV